MQSDPKNVDPKGKGHLIPNPLIGVTFFDSLLRSPTIVSCILLLNMFLHLVIVVFVFLFCDGCSLWNPYQKQQPIWSNVKVWTVSSSSCTFFRANQAQPYAIIFSFPIESYRVPPLIAFLFEILFKIWLVSNVHTQRIGEKPPRVEKGPSQNFYVNWKYVVFLLVVLHFLSWPFYLFKSASVKIRIQL